MKRYSKTVLLPRRLCETQAGNLAHAVGRIAFRPGRPMLVEHLGGLYLEHDLCGTVVTPGYGMNTRSSTFSKKSGAPDPDARGSSLLGSLWLCLFSLREK
ncbi:MAG TPA: hypothetical protein VHP34_01670 [Alphaproteobacteria bacterium]|nr:hypothetical protein [Alphaproteobacteria bacterium]